MARAPFRRAFPAPEHNRPDVPVLNGERVPGSAAGVRQELTSRDGTARPFLAEGGGGGGRL